MNDVDYESFEQPSEWPKAEESPDFEFEHNLPASLYQAGGELEVKVEPHGLIESKGQFDGSIKRNCHQSNFSSGRAGHKIRGLVLHTSVGSLSSIRDWFARDHKPYGQSQSSTHYSVGPSGEIDQYVKEEDTAYANGIVRNPTYWLTQQMPGVNPNLYTVSIERVDNGQPDTFVSPKKQIDAMLNLAYYLTRKHKIPIHPNHITGHHSIRSDKTCPGTVDVAWYIQEMAKMAKKS